MYNTGSNYIYPQGGLQNNPYLNQNYNSYPYQQMGYQQANQIMQQPTVQHSEVLNGTIVDSVDVVKSKNCALDGTPQFYPKSDLSEIYCKKLNVNTGAGMLLTYKLVSPIGETNINQTNDSVIMQRIERLDSSLEELKNLILDNITQPQSSIAQPSPTNVFTRKGGVDK